MRWRRPARTRNGHTLGISLLILSLVHTPLPAPDFHKVRHQDGPGEVCEHHDHLLRWHSGMTTTSDVAVLHWHWFLPGPAGADASHEGPGLAVHAHAPDWQAAAWADGPQVVATGTASRPMARPVPSPLELPLAVPGPALLGFVPACGGRPPLAFGATFAPRISLATLLHRWVC